MLLLDANLSPNLVNEISKIFPKSIHVISIGLEQDDIKIRDFALDNNLTIVSKDQDFYQYYLQFGFPPKIIWIKRGNCRTKEIPSILLENQAMIHNFIKEKEVGLLILK